jgi:Family of unknown function (DUF6169)
MSEKLMQMYNFSFIGGVNNSYVFTTENYITYQVKFKDSSYLFDRRLNFEVYAFELVIEIEENPSGIKPPLDGRMPITISTIFKDFCGKFNERVIIYICDSSDVRQEARRRKFNQWVDLFKGDEFLKFDTAIKENLKITYHSSLIIRDDNPYKMQIIEAFINLGKEQDK